MKHSTDKQIYFATFLGGPIPAGILISRNFKCIGDDKKASLTLMLTFVITILSFFGLMQIPDAIIDKIPNFVFSGILTLIVYLIYHKYFKNLIANNILLPENRLSNWTVVGISILGLLISLAIIFGIASKQPAFPGDKIEYGTLKHEIFYDSGTVEYTDLILVGSVLSEYGIFNDEAKRAVRIDKAENKYILNLEIQKTFWEDNELIDWLLAIKSDLKKKTGKEFNILLISYEFSGKTSTKEI